MKRTEHHLPDIQIRIGDFGSLAPYQQVTFVIPWMDNGNALRLRNLRFLLETLNQLGAHHVLLASQGSSPIDLPKNVEVFEIPGDGSTIKKSALINSCIPLAREWFFQVDADLIFDYQKCLIRSNPVALNLPYKFFQMLTSPQTDRLVNVGSVSVKQNKALQNSAPVAGGFLMKAALLGGRFTFNEKLRGWGKEDVDFFARVRGRFPTLCLPYYGVHLDHGPDRI